MSVQSDGAIPGAATFNIFTPTPSNPVALLGGIFLMTSITFCGVCTGW